MLASIYRSPKKDEMYLYITTKDDFSTVPDELMSVFGKPEFALQLNLAKREKLSRVDIDEVKTKLTEQGYFLQMPPVINGVEE
jgi:uncharacterized protein YcgL (UPF0745 family)